MNLLQARRRRGQAVAAEDLKYEVSNLPVAPREHPVPVSVARMEGVQRAVYHGATLHCLQHPRAVGNVRDAHGR